MSVTVLARRAKLLSRRREGGRGGGAQSAGFVSAERTGEEAGGAAGGEFRNNNVRKAEREKNVLATERQRRGGERGAGVPTWQRVGV